MERFLSGYQGQINSGGRPLDVSSLYVHRDALRAVFDLMDLNDDGILTAEEWRQGCECVNEAEPTALLDADRLFAAADANGDGHITFDEFISSVQVCGYVDGIGRTYTLREQELVGACLKAMVLNAQTTAISLLVRSVHIWNKKSKGKSLRHKHRS